MAGFDEKTYEVRYLPVVRDLFYREQRIADAFLRYGLELDEDDTAAIESRVAAVHLYWARKFNHPTDGLLYKTLHGDAEVWKQLKDPSRRKLLRLSVADERATRERKRVAELDGWITLAATDGYLTPEGVASLVSRLTAQGFDEALVRQRIAQIPVRGSVSAASLEEGLPEATRKQIQVALTILGKRDLYEFLQLPPEAGSDLWKTRYTEAHDKARKGGVGPRAEATNKLLGIIKQSVLEKPEAYATAREFVLAQSLEPRVQQLGVNGTLSEKGYEALFARGLELGLSDRSCAAALRWLASKHKIGIAVKPGADDASATVCVACHKIVRVFETLERCPHCSQPLWAACPECSERVPAGSSQCSRCGFPVARKQYVDGLLELGTSKLRAGNLKDTLDCLEDLDRVWMGGRTATLRKDYEHACNRLEQLCTDLRGALAQHEPYRALDMLAQLRTAGAAYVFRDGSTVPGLEAMVNRALAEVEKVLVAARSALSGREETKAVLLFEQALRQAHDCVEARDGLSRCAPEPAALLRCSVNAKSVSLDWRPSPAIGTVEYIVVSRDDRAPRTPQDGTEVGVTKDVSWEDCSLPPGAARFYSVFTRRFGGHSGPASSGAVLGLFEARGLRIAGEKNRVCGSWEMLPSSARAVVTRTSPGNAPGAAGEEIACGPSGFTDTAVSIGKEYDYKVAVEYSIGGRQSRTRGAVVRVALEAPPEPIAELEVRKKSATEIEIVWKPPVRGSVYLFALPEPPPYKPAAVVDRSAFEEWMPHRIAQTGNSAQWSRPSSRPRFLTAVTVLRERAAIGPSVMDLEDVSGLKGTNQGGRIELLWTWPEGCRTVCVAWRNDRFAASLDEAKAGTRIVTDGKYHVDGGFHLDRPEQKDYFFTVFPGVTVDDTVRYGGGSSDGSRVKVRGGRRQQVTYDVKRKLLSRKYELKVESGEPGSVLPDVKLICKRQGPKPVQVSDGETVVSVLNKNSPYSVIFDLPGKGYLRLFLAQSKYSDRFQIVDPDRSQLDRTL